MPNKLVVVGCSCGGSETLSYLLPKLKLGENSLLIAPHISNKKIYYSIKSENKVLLRCQEEIVKSGFTYVVDYTLFEELSGLKQQFVFDDPNYKIEINEQKIKGYITKYIDGIMEAAANGYGKKCIGVILSGSGEDGSDGLKRIKARKGIVLVQMEEDSSYYDKFCYKDEMALAALEKTNVDFKGPLPELAKKLNEYLATK